MDSSSALATVAAEASGALPLGILLNDVVNIDQTRQHLNWHQDEVQQGGKVTILTKGFVVTDQISGTPTAGQTAYVADSGQIAGTQDGTAVAIGRFLSTKDADGYAKVSINLP
jgi:antitoxin (DNA-binding transcriptional repressor) of toxin-antitoxin stability system